MPDPTQKGRICLIVRTTARHEQRLLPGPMPNGLSHRLETRALLCREPCLTLACRMQVRAVEAPASWRARKVVPGSRNVEPCTDIDRRRRSAVSRINAKTRDVAGLHSRRVPVSSRFPGIAPPARNRLPGGRCTYAWDDWRRTPWTADRIGIRDSDDPR